MKKLKMKEKNPKISVIMPVYNTEKYVWEAIESILDQSFTDFEFIIIDDCSTDKSYEICREYSKKDERIRLFRNEENLKIVKTLNKAIDLSQWEFIARMDSDDIVDLTRLEKQLNYLQKYSLDIVSSNLIFIDKIWKEIWKRKYQNKIKNIILNESPICHACSIIRKQCFEDAWKYNDFNLAEDYDLWLRFFWKSYKFWVLDDYLYYYRIFDEGGKSSKLKQQLKATINVKENAIKKYNLKFNFPNYLRLYIEKFLYYFVPSKIILKLFLLLKWK